MGFAELKDARLSPNHCLDVLIIWLDRELGLAPEEARLLDAGGRLWIQFKNLRLSENLQHLEMAYLRGILWTSIPSDLDATMSTDTVLVTLYASDPTPSNSDIPQGHVITRPAGSYAVALTAFRNLLVAKTALRMPDRWGESISWPFGD